MTRKRIKEVFDAVIEYPDGTKEIVKDVVVWHNPESLDAYCQRWEHDFLCDDNNYGD